jgi:hypothetical protein
MWYVLYVAVSVAVGVLVYRLTATAPAFEQDPEMWLGTGAAPAEQAPPPPPSNFERLSISHERRTWHDRVVGSLGLVVVVAVGAASLAFAAYLAGMALVRMLESIAPGPPS